MCAAALAGPRADEEVDVPEVYIQDDNLELGSQVTVQVRGVWSTVGHL